MLHTRMETRHWKRGAVLRAAVLLVLVGLCSAGPRPWRRRHPRHPLRTHRVQHSYQNNDGASQQFVHRLPYRHGGQQQVQFPSLHDQGSQRVQYPSLNDQGSQQVQYPSPNDRDTQQVVYPTPDSDCTNVQVPDTDSSSAIQKCSPGFYRERNGHLPGRCVPCSCNGLSNECEEGTGRCLNCQHNTAGDRCEQCREGYHGNAAQRNCRPCPCPHSGTSNNFAIGCREASGRIQCICKPGYTGERCERCAPGYYGEPLSYGGSCRPCNCNGNPGYCDSRTGVCKNTLEPKDTNTDASCVECDNCAQTLINDLDKWDDELARIKSQLEKANASSSSQERLKKLEEAITRAKAVVNDFTSSVNRQKSKVSEMEEDTNTLKEDVNQLKKQAEKKRLDANNALDNAEDSHQRAKILNTQIEAILKKIQDLLKQLQNASSNGESVTPDELARMLEEAERLVQKMRERELKDQKDAAEKEGEQAHKLLDYIKTNVTQQCDQNKKAAEKIEGLLNDYNDKLKELEEALKQAKDLVGRANNQNDLNSEALADLLKRIKDLEKERDKVADEIAMAKDQLKETGDLLSTLDESKQGYERLAAQLDGANTDLLRRLNEIKKAADKEGLVIRAEEHAQKLSDLAKQLEKAVNESSGNKEVRNALAAIDAYKSIVDAINAAKAAADEAKEAADKASKDINSKDLVKKAKDLKDKGDKLVKTASDAEKSLSTAATDLADQKNRLEDAKKKKDQLEEDLKKAKDGLNDIQRDDIAGMISEAKKAAGTANDTASDALGRLEDIKKEVEKMNVSVSPGGSNLDNVLNDVDKSVKKLNSTIPSLLDKISQIEELSSQTGPITNVSENIKRIKELIEQARDAANKVVVPMNFQGDGHVELRPPKNMDDLKAYTSLSLFLQRPPPRGDAGRRRRQLDGDLFVMYLGNKDASSNYIGMALKSNILHTVFKLNGVENVIKSDEISESQPNPATFDQVDFKRMYEDVQVNLTKDITNKQTPFTTGHKRGDPAKNLLDIDPKDMVFYIGGYPSSFTPPASLNFPMYKGCIELRSFNDRNVSLYNFQHAENIGETPCSRHVPTPSSSFFEGTGYGEVDLGRKALSNVQQIITTNLENAVLAVFVDGDSYYAVSLEDGHYVLHGRVNGADLEPKKSTVKVTPMVEEDFRIHFSKTKKDIKVIYNSVPVLSGEYIPLNFNQYFVGGLPQHLREKFNIRTQPLKGCVKTVKVNNGFGSFIDRSGISKGCPATFLESRLVELSKGGSLETEVSTVSPNGDIMVSLGFRTTEPHGTLITKNEQAKGLQLTLDAGHVVLKGGDRIIRSKNKYDDGKWHYVTAKKNGPMLVVDDTDAGEEQANGQTPSFSGTKVILGKNNFDGCITNLYTRRPDHLYYPEDVSSFNRAGAVHLDTCSSQMLPEEMLAGRIHNNSRKDQSKEVGDSGSDCSLPAQVKHGHFFGGLASGLTYKVSDQDLQNKPSFSVDVRTKSSDGLLFYVSSDGPGHLALYMAHGRIRLSVRRKMEIFNRERYNDGKWHTVVFSLEKRKFRLLVDGIRAQDGQLSPEHSADMKLLSPLHLGSAPTSLHQELKWKNLPKESVVGCVRNFKMNGVAVGEPATTHGVGPCFDRQTENGAYFSGKGGYAIANDSFEVGENFDVVFEMRPRNLTGLLLHVGNHHHFSLFMRGGEVVAQVNVGAGTFSVSVRPKQSLCDGVFHRVAVIKQNNVVEMYVDTDGYHTIGSASPPATMTKGPLYVGGIPGTFKTVALPIRTPFTGCMQNMYINEKLVAFEKLPKVFGSVNLRACPAG